MSALLQRAKALAARLWQAAQALLFPQRVACCLCGMPLREGEGALCGDCQRALNTLALPPERVAKFKTPLAFELAAYRYRDEARELTHRLKYGGALVCALPLGEGMARAFALRPQAADVIVPVPLHASRMAQRGYNQAEALAQALSLHTGLPVNAGLLERRVATASQVGKSRAARRKNVRNAFAAHDAQNLRVVLVDDVRTPGATAEACAQALLEAGARSVGLLTACRV